MTPLFHILYAAHTRNTHHKLALDACGVWRAWTPICGSDMFLAHAKLYLEGSKAPDNEFKDFRNHVLHTRDGYWGGAPEKVRSWYQHTVDALAKQDWPTAAYCAGVLSHYYTDPLQPLHTAQSEAENNVHRAIEWSISRPTMSFTRWARTSSARSTSRWRPIRTGWPSSSARRRKANVYYEKLIAHYDIRAG